MATRMFSLGTMAIVCALALAPATVAFGQATAETAESAPATSSAEDATFTIINIEHLPVADADAIIRKIFPFEQIVSSPLPSTNQLILRADKRVVDVVQALLLKVDKPARRAKGTQVGGPGPIGLPGPPQSGSPNADQLQYPEYANLAAAPGVSSYRNGWRLLSADYQDTEKESRAIAEKLRTALKTMGKDHPKVATLRAELHDHVNAMFDQRQDVHTRRIHELENKLHALRQKVEQQQEARKRMVDQRIEQLMAGRVASRMQAPRSTENPHTFSTPLVSLNAPNPDSALKLLTQVAETQNRIAGAEAEYAAVTAEYERARAQFKQIAAATSKADRLKLEADGRILSIRRKAALAEVDAARKLYEVFKTQVATHRDLLRNDVELAEVALRKAQRDLERASLLQDNNAISESELDSIQTTMDRARLKLERAKRIMDAFEQQSK